jgi:ABC-type multidrug transport system fused ATPase/permease subunit
MAADHPPSSLATLFTPWHPRYRTAMLQLGTLSTIVGLLVYAESVALGELTRAFSVHAKTPGSGELLVIDRTLREIKIAADALGAMALPLFVLLLFCACRLIRLLIDVVQRRRTARLQNQARSELEAEVLVQLLRKEDAFFSSRPAGEILNRLSADVARVVDQRLSVSQGWQSIFLILGNLVFFVVHAWQLAIAGAVICGLSAWWMDRVTRPVQAMDRAILTTEDRIKARFEDRLRASAEVQVGDLGAAVLSDFDVVQDERRRAYVKYIRVTSRLGIVSGLGYVLAFASFCVALIYTSIGRKVPDIEIVLIPIILKSLPELFTNSASLVMSRLADRLAETSKARLLEYESGAAAFATKEAPDTAPPGLESIHLENVSYQYATPEGGLSGGVIDVSTSFGAGRWVAIVGAAGSGKSTMTQLILGRIKPLHGHIRFGNLLLDEMSPQERARHLTLMPQTLSILDVTIEENLFFGRRRGEPRAFSAEDIELIEDAGLGAICRAKALGMIPGDALPSAPDFGPSALGLRSEIRALFVDVGAKVTPYEQGGVGPQHWVLEGLLGGRCDRRDIVSALTSRSMREVLKEIVKAPLGEKLIAHATRLLSHSRALLALPQFAQFAKLSPVPLEERVWQLRTSLKDVASNRQEQARRLVLIALTSLRLEVDEHVWGELRDDHNQDPSVLDALRVGLGATFCRFDVLRIHPFLNWRENILFGSVDSKNSRMEHQVEQKILSVVEANGLGPDLARIGLGFQVGRGGVRLSGGQRQLVAMVRALLRRTPIAVLDEPTAALDPNSRSRVARLLEKWKQQRLILTVTHDPELVKDADEVRLLDRGRLVASGTFDELVATSATFRETMKVETEPMTG